MGYFHEIWKIFKKNLKKNLKNLKKFKKLKNRKIILDFEKELYLARSATSPWVPPCFFYIFAFFLQKGTFL